MKKYYFLIIVALILGLVLTGCSLLSNIGQAPATEQSGISYLTKGTEAEPESFPLYAGQDWLVGEVLVWDDGTQLCVKYQLFPGIFDGGNGWGITETHLAVATDPGDIPQTKRGNPIPGQFLYGDDDLPGVEETEPYCIPFGEGEGELDVECGGTLSIAAHAVVKKTLVSCDDPVVLLATENNHPSGSDEMEAKIWSITSSGTTTMISNIVTPVQSNTDNFNGNAYDDVNNRFYFSDYPTLGDGISPLYFNDLEGNQLYAGDLSDAASGGTFYDGSYYYIAERTDDLRQVTFDGTGMVSSDVVIAEIFPGTSKVLAFGDIDIQSGVIYGSATEIPGYAVVFFSLNLDGSGYNVIKTGSLYGAGGTQISFGSDGVLYGVNARSPFELFSIDTSTGDTMWISSLPVALSDLASGPVCVPQYESETAWAANDEIVEGQEGTIQFDGKNWATYFTYIFTGLPIISSDDLAGPFTAGELGEFSVTTVNPDPPCGQEYLCVLFNFTIFDFDLLDIASFDAYWGGGWHNELLTMSQVGDDVTGYFGPQTGFLMSAPYNVTTDFEITFGAAAVTGTYMVKITLDSCIDPFEQLAFFTTNVVVNSP